jgi:hypothetical protein
MSDFYVFRAEYVAVKAIRAWIYLQLGQIYGENIPLVTEPILKLDEADAALEKEAGDILWQLSGLCTVMGWSLEGVAEHNLAKLAARKQNGTIAGSGDGVTKEERG